MSGAPSPGDRPRSIGKDALAGFVTGLFSVPEGMANAAIGGFNPVLGLYAGIVPTILGSFLARTTLMIVTLTSAIALTSRSVLEEAGYDPSGPDGMAVAATLTLLVGAFMAILGLIAYGTYDLTNLAVMKGFTTKIAIIDMIWGTVLTGAVSTLTVLIGTKLLTK